MKRAQVILMADGGVAYRGPPGELQGCFERRVLSTKDGATRERILRGIFTKRQASLPPRQGREDLPAYWRRVWYAELSISADGRETCVEYGMRLVGVMPKDMVKMQQAARDDLPADYPRLQSLAPAVERPGRPPPPCAL
jgi:ABC-type antimicrobial peptide transport system ATPase subunit